MYVCMYEKERLKLGDGICSVMGMLKVSGWPDSWARSSKLSSWDRWRSFPCLGNELGTDFVQKLRKAVLGDPTDHLVHQCHQSQSSHGEDLKEIINHKNDINNAA